MSAAGPGGAATLGPWVVAALLGVAVLLPGRASGSRRLERLAATGRGGWVSVRVAAEAVQSRQRVPRTVGLVAVGAAGATGASVPTSRPGDRRPRLARRLPWAGTPPTTDLAATVSELAGLVRAGVPPAVAWALAADGARGDPLGAAVRAAAAAAAEGRSLADELDSCAQALPTQEAVDLTAVAVSWRVSERAGAPVADVLDRVAQSLRDGADVRAARTAAIAAPMATARVLAVLPVLGLGLGEAMGAAPVQVLVGTPLGRMSGVVGLCFAVAGTLWTRRLLRSAARAS